MTNSKPLKIIFAGTAEFALPSLKVLLQSRHTVAAVYTQPDRPAGRGQKVKVGPIKQLATEYNIPVEQPLSLKTNEAQDCLKAYQADLMVVVAYGLLLPKAVLEIPRYGCINVHPSLLPRWRGAAPIQHTILAGDTETGVTIMQMDKGWDTGDSLYQTPYTIATNETSKSLHDKMATLGAKALLTTIDGLSERNITPTPQDHAGCCYAGKIEKQHAELDWNQSAITLERCVRGYYPWPIAFTHLDGITLRLWEAVALPTESTATPGTIVAVNKEGIDVSTHTGILRLLRLQFPGKRSLPIHDVLNAHQSLFQIGKQFGSATTNTL